MDTNKVPEYDVNTVVSGKYCGARLIKRGDVYYVGDAALYPGAYESFEKLTGENGGSSGYRRAVSNAKTIIGTLTLTLPLYAGSARNDAEMVTVFAEIKWRNGESSILYMQEELFKEITGKKDIMDLALGTGEKIRDLGIKAIEKIKPKQLQPVFESDYRSGEFNVPTVIKIVDGASKPREKQFDGAIGWKEQINKLEVLTVYNSFAKSSGISFSPGIQCNAIYYQNPHSPNQYIMVDELFSEVQNARTAELEHVAYALGAKYFRIEMTDMNTVNKQRERKAQTSANAAGYVKAEASASENSDSYEKTDRSIIAETHFEEIREPERPALSWFAENPKINSLVNMRLGAGKMKSHDIYIRCSTFSIMNSEIAGNLDAVIKKIGAKQNAKIKKHVEKERDQVLIFHIEF